MNLVKKWAQELGLSESFINGLTGSWGSGIVEGVEEGWMLILELYLRMNSFSSRFSGASRSELSRVLRTVILWGLFVRPLLLYILLLHPSWPSICWSYRSLLEYLSHPALSSTCCELQQKRWHCSGVIPSLMRPECQLWAFNAEVTAFSIIAPPPCPHSCPPMLVLLFGTTGKVALDGVLLFPSMTSVRRGQDSLRRCLLAALGFP